MNLNKINEFEIVINSSLGGEDNPIPYLWMSIADNNTSFTIKKVHSAFISTLRFLLERDIIGLAGAYDDKNKCEDIWKGQTEDLIAMLYKFIYGYEDKDFNKDPLLFYSFKYCFMQEKKSWPIDVSKYDEELICMSDKTARFWEELADGSYDSLITNISINVIQKRWGSSN